MQYPTLAAAILMAGTTGLHIVGGGAEFHAPIQASTLDLPLRAIAAVLWHFATIMLALQTGALLWLTRHPDRAMTTLLAAIQIGFAGVFLFYGWTMLGTVWILGQWTIFVVLALLILWGQYGAERAR